MTKSPVYDRIQESKDTKQKKEVTPVKCALELVVISKEAEALRVIEEARRLEEQKRLAKEARERTIKWCETVLSNYLEKYAETYSSFGKGGWTYECGKGHKMHFSGKKHLYPLREDSTRYSNGERSYSVASVEYLDLQTIVEYCAKFCIEVNAEPHNYKRYGSGVQEGTRLQFRISPDCLKDE